MKSGTKTNHLFNLLCLFLFASIETSAGVFDRLSKVPQEERLDSSLKIFNHKILSLDSINAFIELDNLLKLSYQLKDKELEVTAVSYKGVYIFSKSSKHKEIGIDFLKGALQLSKDYGLKAQTAKITHQIGASYCLLNNFPNGFEYLIKADKMMQEIGYENIPHVSTYLYNLSWAYQQHNNYSKSKYYLKETLKYDIENSRSAIAANNSLGINYVESLQYDSAIVHHNKALQLAENKADSLSIGIIKGNLGNAYMLLGKNETAKTLLQEGYEICIKKIIG